MPRNFFSIFLLCYLSVTLRAQPLQPGFNKEEYRKLMLVSAQFGDSAYQVSLPAPAGFRAVYRSPEMGLKNKWELWMTDHSIPVISIRGTTADALSWLGNFYAAMVPAKGELHLSEGSTFAYQLASNPRAAVHVGWLVSTAFLVKDMLPKIDSLYKKGAKEMLIIGHSQGGAIAYLLTAYLYNLQKQNLLPADIRFKTYCSAGPKPGNLYFAYEYEAMTQGGWAYNVVNSADWVPETPVSIQTDKDFNPVNPFVNIKDAIKKQSFFKRIALNYAHGKLTKYNKKAVDNYRKYLGGYAAKEVRKQLPGFTEPEYAATNDYVRTGATITLLADDAYYQRYPQDASKIFINHFHQPYLYLLNKLSMNGTPAPASAVIDGTWELKSITGEDLNFESLFPTKKPFLAVDGSGKKVSGNTGCNTFNATITLAGDRINFPAAMAMTRMACAGDGEARFLAALKKITSYSVSGDELYLLTGDAPLLRFVRK